MVSGENCMRIHQITIFLAFILAGIVLSSIVSIYPCSADTNQLQVTVTSSPAVYTPGSTCQIHATVTYNGQPAQKIPVQFILTGAQATISPVSGSADGSGSFSATLTTTSSTSGVIHVLAQARDFSCPSTYVGAPCTEISAEGFVDIQQQAQAQPQAPVYQPVPQPQTVYQPPQPVYQPPPQPVYQPQQPATSQQPVAVITVDKYAVEEKSAVLFDGQKSYAPGGSISTYAWNFGDGSTGSGYVAQHQYATPGTYAASLVVTDNTGLSSTPATTQITVFSGAEAPVYNIGGTCDDGNKCTINDNYDASGKCVAGQLLNCDDNDPRTVDVCEPAKGCVHYMIMTGKGEIAAEQTPAPPISTTPWIYPDIPGYTPWTPTRWEMVPFPNQIRALPGSIIQIPIMIRNADKIASITIPEFVYRDDFLRFDHWTKGTLSQNAVIDTVVKPLQWPQGWPDTMKPAASNLKALITDPKGITGDGTLVVYYFKVMGKMNDVWFVGGSFDKITAIRTDGSSEDVSTDLNFIVAIAHERGDCCGDGGITSADVLCAEDMALEKIQPDFWACDMNGDGRITDIDVWQIAKLVQNNPLLKKYQVDQKKCLTIDCSQKIYQLSDIVDNGLSIMKTGPAKAYSNVCPSPKSPCGGNCIDLQTDPGNCGSCGNKCGQNMYCCHGHCIMNGVICQT